MQLGERRWIDREMNEDVYLESTGVTGTGSKVPCVRKVSNLRITWSTGEQLALW